MATAEEHTDSRPLRAEPTRSLKERILSLPRGRPVKIDMRKFPDWPQDELYAKPPKGEDIAHWEQSGIEYGRRGRAKIKFSRTRKAELIQITLSDASGTLLFGATEEKAKVKEAREIAAFDANVINHLFRECGKVAGQIDADDDDDEEDEEEGN